MSERMTYSRKSVTITTKQLLIAACIVAVVGAAVAALSLVSYLNDRAEREAYQQLMAENAALEELYRFEWTGSGYKTIDYIGQEAQITAPSSYNGYPVVSIGDNTYRKTTELTTMIIPDGVTAIELNAFLGCENLKEISIPSSVACIEGSAFEGCRKLASVTIPEGVTSIEAFTFAYCRSLRSIIIPDSVTTIGRCAFLECLGIREITIPDSVAEIKDSVFSGCTITVCAPHPAEYYGYTPDQGVTWVTEEQ